MAFAPQICHGNLIGRSCFKGRWIIAHPAVVSQISTVVVDKLANSALATSGQSAAPRVDTLPVQPMVLVKRVWLRCELSRNTLSPFISHLSASWLGELRMSGP